MLPGLPDRQYYKRPVTASICAFFLINEELWYVLAVVTISLATLWFSDSILGWRWKHSFEIPEAALIMVQFCLYMSSPLCVSMCSLIKLVTVERGAVKILLGPQYALMLLLRHFAPVRTVQIVSIAHKRSRWNAIVNMASQHVYAYT